MHNKTAFQSIADHPWTAWAERFFVPVTLTLIRWPWYEFNQDILKTYLCTKYERSRSRLSKVRAIDRRDRTHYHAAMPVTMIVTQSCLFCHNPHITAYSYAVTVPGPPW